MFFKKKQKVSEKRPKIDRILAEDLIDQEMTCEEIAEQLGCDAKHIYVIKQAKKRRELRMGGSSTDLNDPIRAMNVEIKKIDLEIKKEELEHKLRLKQREHEEDLFEGVQDIVEESEDPLMTLISSGIKGFIAARHGGSVMPSSFIPPYTSGGMNNSVITLPPPQSQIQPNTAAIPEALPGTVTLSDDEINAVLEQYKDHLARFQKLPDSVIIKFLDTYFSQLTNETKNRVLAAIKKTKVKVVSK